MTDKFLKTISNHQMITADCTVGVGLSGGADSVALLHLLVSNRDILKIKNIIAVHVNHGIRGVEADNDLKFSQKLCEAFGVDFVSFKTDIPSISKETGEGIEECARRIRYEFFEKTDCDVFATAHNLNDNAETFILNFVRGSSLNGLCGIPYKRGQYIRPLLDCTRDEIENYISLNNLDFVTDSTNLSDDYTRNLIRHNVVSQFFSINPAFDKAFSKCLDSICLSNDFILNEAERFFKMADKTDYYDCSVFENCHPAVKYQIISMILKQKKAKNISRDHILLVNGIITSGGFVDIGDGITITVERKKLFFKKKEPIEYFDIEFDIFSNEIETSIGIYKVDKDLQFIHKKDIENLIDCDKIVGAARLRNRKDGDEYSPINRKCTKTLKRLFNDFKVDISKRSKMLILCDDIGIVWTEYFGVAERCKVSDKAKNIISIKKVGE